MRSDAITERMTATAIVPRATPTKAPLLKPDFAGTANSAVGY